MGPKCGVPMVPRTVGRSERKGKPFYGCSNFLRCQETQGLEGTPA